MARHARFGGHGELAAGQLLGQPDLAHMHTPGHSHHDSGQPHSAEPEHRGDYGVSGTGCYGCEHVFSPDRGGRRISIPGRPEHLSCTTIIFKHIIENLETPA
jgi:hypothetical protein